MYRFYVLLIAVIALTCGAPAQLNAQAKKISLEELGAECRGTARKDRVRVTVARFSVTSRAAKATGQFGDELTTMLTSALQQTNCFRVLENARIAQADMSDELEIGLNGAANGSAVQQGQMLGAQVIFTAEITEYSEGKSNTSLAGVSVGKKKAKLGMIIMAKDPMTRELLWSRSLSAEGKKGGFTGLRILGFETAGSNNVSEAMSAAMEDIIYSAVETLVRERQTITAEFDPQDNLPSVKSWNKSNCKMLMGFSAPKIMVVLPEYHIQRRIPDPAGETEIIRQLTEAGFQVIDPAVLATIRDGVKFEEAARNPMAAVALGQDFGADIVIFGEAFSEATSGQGSMITSRARVEFKAVNTHNSTILAANGMHAGAQDLTESSAAKKSLQKAGELAAQYLLEQICK